MNYDKAPVIFQVIGQYVVIRYMFQRFIILSDPLHLLDR